MKVFKCTVDEECIDQMRMNVELFKCTLLPAIPIWQCVNYVETGNPFSSTFLIVNVPAAAKHFGVTTAAGQGDHST